MFLNGTPNRGLARHIRCVANKVMLPLTALFRRLQKWRTANTASLTQYFSLRSSVFWQADCLRTYPRLGGGTEEERKGGL
jgi:hypothetical protein